MVGLIVGLDCRGETLRVACLLLLYIYFSIHGSHIQKQQHKNKIQNAINIAIVLKLKNINKI